MPISTSKTDLIYFLLLFSIYNYSNHIKFIVPIKEIKIRNFQRLNLKIINNTHESNSQNISSILKHLCLIIIISRYKII